MFKIKIVIDRGRDAEMTDAGVLEVESLHDGAPVLHRVGHAMRRAPREHRFMTLLAFAGLWAVLEFVMHMEAAAKTVEIFGVVPFSDSVVKFIFGGE